jgi:hypothetical protein
MIRKIQNGADDGRSAIRSVWVDVAKDPTHVNIGLLSKIYRLSHRLRGNFQDMADHDVNNQDLCNESASFLIEAAGEFKEAFRWKARASMVEQGSGSTPISRSARW